MEQNVPELLTKAETAELLQVSIKTLERWNRSGLLVPFRLGRRSVRYRREDVAAFVQESQAASA